MPCYKTTTSHSLLRGLGFTNITMNYMVKQCIEIRMFHTKWNQSKQEEATIVKKKVSYSYKLNIGYSMLTHLIELDILPSFLSLILINLIEVTSV